jgi:hypothetical protein
VSEHDFEAVRGLPGQLPEGEHILWQGAPRWTLLAQRAFHIRAVGAYFAGMLVWRVGDATLSGVAPLKALVSALTVTPIALLALGMLAGFAWLNARTTVYTLTNRRLVLRFGVALPKAINIPFNVIDSAALKDLPDGAGDLALTLKAPNRIGFLHLWPHTRPWKMSTPEPTLRNIPGARAVAGLLANAIQAQKGTDTSLVLTREAAPTRDKAPMLAAA